MPLRDGRSHYAKFIIFRTNKRLSSLNIPGNNSNFDRSFLNCIVSRTTAFTRLAFLGRYLAEFSNDIAGTDRNRLRQRLTFCRHSGLGWIAWRADYYCQPLCGPAVNGSLVRLAADCIRCEDPFFLVPYCRGLEYPGFQG